MTTTLQPIPLPGCRHDVLGHALKAIGVLRAISACAAMEDRDSDAEGWWDPDSAAFMIRSARYPDAASLVKFFSEKYRPTPIIAAWNKSGGVTDKIEVSISCRSGNVSQFRADNEALLEASGLKKTKKLSKAGTLVFTALDTAELNELQHRATASGLAYSHKEKRTRGTVTTELTFASGIGALERFLEEQSEALAELGFAKSKPLSKSGQLKLSTDSSNRSKVEQLVANFNTSLIDAATNDNDSEDAVESAALNGPLQVDIIAKESGKKDGTLPNVQRLLSADPTFRECLESARRWVDALQGGGRRGTETDTAIIRYRDQLPESVSESFDALAAVHLSRYNNNPLFVNRGQQGSTDIFLMYWGHFLSFRKHPDTFGRSSLLGERVVGSGGAVGHDSGRGTPFFPDAIKNYNQGLDWVTEAFPFSPLDYLLAVEGALAMRGAVSKSLHAQSRSFAAFPFVFEGAETMTDDQGDVTGLGASFWFPIWTRPATFGELHSFILDSQSRLPRKECRFSSDFARAVRSQGVDAGFAAFQEFRFKMKGARVPWAVSGRFVTCSATASANVLNELLAPVDASGFLNQFEFNRERKADLHPLRAPVLEAIETAAAEPDAPKILAVLNGLATLNARLARSKSLREKVRGGRVTFVPSLRCGDWANALQDLDSDPEFQVARALASINRGESKREPDGKFFNTEPFLGSLVPLRLLGSKWILPEKPDPPSQQAVWTGIDLAHDLAAVLSRRVLDSAKDARPAIVGNWTVRLPTILRFLRGELDDRRIANLVEALSLIDWRFQPSNAGIRVGETTADERLDPVPVAYAAARSLLEIACDSKMSNESETVDKKRPLAVVQRTVALLCRQDPCMAASATVEALRRLSVVGVPNPYGEETQRQKPRLAGRDVVQVGESLRVDFNSARRLAAAVLIPLDWRDRWTLFRSITLPQTTK